MILITGAGGLLGANLVADYCASGLRVSAVARTALPRVRGCDAQSCDLSNAFEARALVERLRPSAIVHCAAMTNVDLCESERALAWQVNAEMPATLAALAAEYGARFVYISTDSVFDGKQRNYREDDPTGPMNAYAASKLDGEKAVVGIFPEAAVVRTNVYGWNMQAKSSLAEWVLGQLERGSTITGFEDVIFCPMLVNDLGDVILKVLDQQLSGTYHVTGSEAVSKFEFARRVASVFGYPSWGILASSIDQSALRAPRPKNTSLNTERIGRALTQRMPTVDEGLKRFKNLRESGYLAALKKSGE